MREIKYHATFYVIGGTLFVVGGIFLVSGQLYIASGPFIAGTFCTALGYGFKKGQDMASKRIKNNMIHPEEIENENTSQKRVYVKDFSKIRKITIPGTTVHQIKETVKEYEARKQKMKKIESNVIPIQMEKEPKTLVYEKDAA